MEKVRLACVRRYSVNLSYERMLRHCSLVGAEKKSNLSLPKKKKNFDCADITKNKDEKIQKF